MESLRPNDERAKTAVILIWVALVMDIISLGSGYMQYDLFYSAVNSGGVSVEDFQANNVREQLIAIVSLIVVIISAVTFIQWFRRAYFNLHQKVNHLSHTEGWAAGAWFVPFVNLYRPYQIMKEMYEETSALLSKNEVSNRGESLSTGTVGAWWGVWIITGILGQIVFRMSMNAEEADALMSITILGMVQSALGIPLAFLAVKVIKDYAKVEPALRDFSYEDDINSIGSGNNEGNEW